MQGRRVHLGMFGCVGLLAACQVVPPGGPAGPDRPQPSEKPLFVSEPRPAPTQPPGVPGSWPRLLGRGGSVLEDFEGAAATLADWKDVREDAATASSWLIGGTWTIEPAVAPRQRTAGHALQFVDDAPQPALSFRRYCGKAFGTPDGELPARYSVSVQVVPLGAREDFFPPVGDLGVPVYYLDPTHYVEVLIKPDAFEAWECNGGEPTKWRGWRQLYGGVASHSAGVAYTLGAEVDSHASTLRIYEDGRFVREIKSDLVQPYTHYFALRAASSRVQFDAITLRGY